MFTRYSPPPTVKTSSIGLPPRLVQTLCVEAARKVQRGRHTGRHGILERRFQHNASVDDLHRHLELVVQPDVPLAEFRPGRRDLLFPLRRGLLIEGLIMNLRLLDPVRSEEHTSELKSLMRISYA